MINKVIQIKTIDDKIIAYSSSKLGNPEWVTEDGKNAYVLDSLIIGTLELVLGSTPTDLDYRISEVKKLYNQLYSYPDYESYGDDDASYQWDASGVDHDNDCIHEEWSKSYEWALDHLHSSGWEYYVIETYLPDVYVY